MNVKEQYQKIPLSIRNMYRITHSNGAIHVHEPAYINIKVDKEFKVDERAGTVDISNSAVCVSLWNEKQIMHTTVYY